jgi:hypothetical protein
VRRISRYRCRRVNEIKAALAQPSRSRVVLERNELDALFPEVFRGPFQPIDRG